MERVQRSGSGGGAPPGTSAVLTLLELLAAEAPQARIEEAVRDARLSGGFDAEEVSLLARAGDLALQVHSLFERRQQREAELAALVDTARDLALPHDLDELLRIVTRRTRTLFGMDMSYISFREGPTGDSYVRTADGHASALTVGYRVPHDAGLGDASARKGVPIWTPDYLADDSVRRSPVLDEIVRAEGLRAIIAAPLTSGADTFGVLYAADRNVRHFSVGDVSLMSSLGGLAAVAIEKARILERRNSDVAELSGFRHFGELYGHLVELALEGGDLGELTAEVAEAFEGAALVLDVERRPLSACGRIPPFDRSDLNTAARTAYQRNEPVPLPRGNGTWVVPVRAGSEELAVLLLNPRGGLDGTGVKRLRTAAQAMAVLLRIQHGDEEAAGPLRDELFEDLLSVPRRPLKQLTARAGRLGIAPDREFVVAVIRPEGGTAGRAASWAASYARRTGGLRSVQGGRIALLLPLPPGQGDEGTDRGQAAGSWARRVADELSSALGHPVTVGAGGPVHGLEGVRKAYQEAMRCLEALVALDSTGASASVEELGFLGVLLSDDNDTGTFVRATIGPVLDYDAQRLTELTRTLDMYFSAGGSPTRAAELLHVHPNTVSRRLERVSELLGQDWSKPERALEVQLALRLHRTHHILRRRRDD